MRTLSILLILFIPFIGFGQSSNSHVIIASDYMIFTPSELTIIEGDTVYFENLTTHNVVEVSEETYTNNGTQSNYGFELYSDDYIEFSNPGTFYYVCTPHVEMGMKGIINVLDFGYNMLGQWSDENGSYYEVSNDSFLIYSFEQENCYILEEFNWVSDENDIALGQDGEFGGSFSIYNVTDDSFSLVQTADQSTVLTSTTFNVSDWVNCDEVTSILTNKINSKKVLHILNALGEKVIKPKNNSPYFYFYDDNSVEKKIIIK